MPNWFIKRYDTFKQILIITKDKFLQDIFILLEVEKV